MKAAPFRYWGAKVRMAPWLISRLPAHSHYVEGCAGSAAILAAKTPTAAETLNDTYGEVVGFFRVLQDERASAALIDRVHATPYARAEFDHALALLAVADELDPVDRAWAFFVSMQMAVVPGRTGWSYGVDGAATAKANKAGRWSSMPEHLCRCVARFARVQIEQLPVVDLIRRYDAPGVLFLVDPPYTDEARPASTSSSSGYVHDDFDHGELIEAVRAAKHAVVAITHYPDPLYDDAGFTVGGDFESHRNNPAGTGRDVAIERLYLAGPVGADLEPAQRPATLFAEAGA